MEIFLFCSFKAVKNNLPDKSRDVICSAVFNDQFGAHVNERAKMAHVFRVSEEGVPNISPLTSISSFPAAGS